MFGIYPGQIDNGRFPPISDTTGKIPFIPTLDIGDDKNLYLCMYIYLCVWIYLCICMHVSMFIYVCICKNLYLCMYIYLYVWIYLCICMHVSMYVYGCMYLYMYISMYKKPISTSCNYYPAHKYGPKACIYLYLVVLTH